MPKLKKLQDDLKEKGFVVVGVHTEDGAEEVPAFVEKQKIDYPVCIDTKDDATAKRFKVDGWPTYVLIDRKGIVREIGLGEFSHELLDKLVAEQPPKNEKDKEKEAKEEKKSR